MGEQMLGAKVAAVRVGGVAARASLVASLWLALFAVASMGTLTACGDDDDDELTSDDDDATGNDDDAASGDDDDDVTHDDDTTGDDDDDETDDDDDTTGDDDDDETDDDDDTTGDDDDDTTDDDDDDDDEIVFCESAVEQLYDPYRSRELDLWPDDAYARSDATSRTGQRLSVTETRWYKLANEVLKPPFGELGKLSGYATVAGAFFRFSAKVAAPPATGAESLSSTGLIFADLSTTPPTRVAYEAVLGDDDTHVLLRTSKPLKVKTRYALVMTRDYASATGGCVAPSKVTRSLLTGTHDDARLDVAAANWRAALDALGIAPGDVSAMTTFTTHDDLAPVIDAAASARASPAAFDANPACVTESDRRVCELTITLNDYRDDRSVDDGDADATYSVPVTAWLPLETTTPVPVVFYGHGLNGARGDGGGVARELVPRGIAVVASDALEHGAHPGKSGSGLDALRFLAIGLNGALDPYVLRGNFEQTSLDRAQIIAAIVADGDLTGDGVTDVDATRFGYHGISLGGMIGSTTTALAPDLNVSVLVVGGGGLVTFATDTVAVTNLIPIFEQAVGSAGASQRLLLALQTFVDAGDPAAWAPYIVERPLLGATARNVLLPVALDDDTVPPRTGYTLARALGVPHVPPVARAVYDLPVSGEGPLTGNLAGGNVTGGYFQYDFVNRGEGGGSVATHGNTPFSRECKAQWLEFLVSGIEGEAATLIDPYSE